MISPWARARLEAWTDRTGDCWVWQAARTRGGYGLLTSERGGPLIYAHRAAYEVATGEDPGDSDVLHTCDNPPCLRPAHLYAGSPHQNGVDMVTRGRAVAALLVPADVRAIRALAAEGMRPTAIKRRLGMHNRSIVSDVVHGRTWAWLDAAAGGPSNG